MRVRFVFSIVMFGLYSLKFTCHVAPYPFQCALNADALMLLEARSPLPQSGGEALFVNKAVFPQQGMWKMAHVSHSTCSPAGNNPEITCRDDALMILVMKKPGLSSAATDWKEPAYVQCNGPSPDNPSESMQSMRPPIWSWNVRGCHVWHLLEHRLCPNTQDEPHPVPFFKPDFEAFSAFHSLLGCWLQAYSVCHETLSESLVSFSGQPL